MFSTDNSSPTQSTQPQQSGADQRRMQAGKADRTPHARSREDEMRDWQRGFAGSM